MPRRIAVDMTPLGPGGENGGAGVVATSLVQHLARLAPDWQLIVLTSLASHADLAHLDAHNVQRVCVTSAPAVGPVRAAASPRHVESTMPGQGNPVEPPRHAEDIAAAPGLRARASPRWLRDLANAGLRRVPGPLRVELKARLWHVTTGRQHARLIDHLGPDLLFCPFTAPYFWRPGLPLVATIHDLQHVAYPHFFSEDQRLNRERHIRQVARCASRLVCISEYVRQTLVAHLPSAAGRAVVIRHALLHPFSAPPTSQSTTTAILDRFGLRPGCYLLYPANFWPHKNHPVLFEALRRYRRQHPEADLRLVCTGAPNAAMDALREQATAHLGAGTVVFPGYVSAQVFEALLAGCAALIYPSLYEGFGLPVLEAMALSKPVVCSNLASLAEVAGDAAIYFDPTSPEQIAHAIDRLHQGDGLVTQLVARGRARAAGSLSAEAMAHQYLAVFAQVLAG